MRRHRTCLVGLLSALLAAVVPLAHSRTLPRRIGYSPEASVNQAPAVSPNLIGVVLPGGRVISPVAWDIDRDGDLDVVGSTVEDAVVIWINDGHGHFTRQRPASVPLAMSDSASVQAASSTALLAAPPSPRWSIAISGERRLVAPPPGSGLLRSGTFVVVRDRASVSRPARAPPTFPPLA